MNLKIFLIFIITSAVIITTKISFDLFKIEKTKSNKALAISFSPFSSHPYTSVEIENQSYLLKIDLGSAYYLSIQKNFLNQLRDKVLLNATTSIDINNNQYHCNCFEVKKARIGKIILENIPIDEEDPLFMAKGSLIDVDAAQDISEVCWIAGRIGVDFFRLHPHWKLCFGKSSVEAILLRSYLDSEIRRGFHSISLEPVEHYLAIQCETAIGKKTFILDSCSNRNLIFSEEIDKPLELKNRDYALGNHMFQSFPQPLFMKGIDGILGIDFLKQFELLVDFEKNLIWFLPQSLFMEND